MERGDGAGREEVTVRDEIAATAEAVARQAGAILVERFTGARVVDARFKSPRNVVTQADLDSETLLRNAISKIFPDHAIVGEEYAARAGSGSPSSMGVCWYIDPLDGTTNFANGIPHWAVSIGALDDAGPLAAAVFDPLRNEMFTAARGCGAYRNGERIRVAEVTKLEDALIATGFAAMRGHEPDHACLDRFREMIVRVKGVRRLGSAALDLSYVATGRFDAFYEEGLSGWDTAAGALLVTEAGGVVRDLSGGDNWLDGGSILAGNPDIVKAMLTTIPHFARAR